MESSATDGAREFYARTYDVSVLDWPGEIDFYQELAQEARSRGQPVLELACGTGRVALRLAQENLQVVGLDRCPAMLQVAQEKSIGISTLRWINGDMRSFELEMRFGLIIIPGHAFQNLVTAADQLAGRWQTGPIRLHCLFRFEMEHLLGRAGFAVDALYGDFFRQELQDDSSEMIWVARHG